MTRRKKNDNAVSLGRLGGLARAKKLTPERRREIAILAVKARIAKRQKEKDHEKGKEVENGTG